MVPPTDLGDVYDSAYAESYMAGVMHGEAFAVERYNSVMAAIAGHAPGILEGRQRKALDVGCGSGRFLAELQRNGWATIGVERSPPLAAFARSQMGLEVLEVDFLGADPPGPFDLVSLFHIIEHFSDPAGALKKAHGLLQPGGALFVETPNWESIGARLRSERWSHFIPPEHLVYFGPRSLRILAESCGFSTRMCRTIAPMVIQSIGSFAAPIRAVGREAYKVSSRLGLGPTLQYLGVRR